jgi:transketolase
LKSQRDTFLDVLFDKAKMDKSIMLLTVDMGAPAIDKWKNDLPEQYLEMGISEQSAINVAAGLSRGGKKVFIYMMAVWVHRCFEQIRYSCAIANNSITILGNGVGLGYAPAGPAHEPNEDIAVMRALHGIQIFCASSSYQIHGIVEKCLIPGGIKYVRLERKTYENSEIAHRNFPKSTFQNSYVFNNGIASNHKIAVISYGQIVDRLLKLLSEQQTKLDDVNVVEISKIWPIDFELLFIQIENCDKVLIIEEQSRSGSLTEALALMFLQKRKDIILRTMHLPDKYIFENGNQEQLLDSLGFSLQSIALEINSLKTSET